MDSITGFERKVVFRVARGYFFAMAIAAVLVFFAGGALVIRSLAKPTLQPPSPLAPPKPRPALSYAQVADYMRTLEDERRAKANRGLEQGDGPQSTSQSQTSRPENPYQTRFGEIERKLRALFSDPSYTWADEIESVCVEPTSFGCLRRENRVKRRGVVGAINIAIAGVARDERIRLLDILIAVLEQTPMPNRGGAIIPTIELERSLARADEERSSKYEAQVAERTAQFRAEVAENDAKHRQWWTWGLYGLGAGFSLLIVVSLFLAFLSMERHTRALEHLVSQLGASSDGNDQRGGRAMPTPA
jgi:hypothetical protein